jgi:PhnB protein
MMPQFHPYLNFKGNTDEAIAYISLFGGEVSGRVTYGQMMGEHVTPGQEEKVANLEYIGSHGIAIMASDLINDHPSVSEVAFNLMINFSTQEEITSIYEKMKTHSEVLTELHDAPWNAWFAHVRDQFGVNWMLHCNKPAVNS